MDYKTLITFLVAFLGLHGHYYVNCAEPTPIVELKVGKVQGLVEAVGTSGKVYHYQGIRYGHAKRFENAQPVESWTGVYNATHAHTCPQFSEAHHGGAENCLFLNVWQPASADTETTNRTVMVWIHGGGFKGGVGNADCRHLAHEGNVVVVSLNYRLGPLGFLYAGVAGHEGNYGLHDQLLALHWVKDNIVHFGGDPAKMVIFGGSAGSWSVSSHILSPLSKGLFHRAIMQSGAMETVGENKVAALRDAHAFATELNCPTDDGTKMIACLQGKSLEEIHGAKVSISRPVYGTDFLPYKPAEALATGKLNQVDLLSGVCNNEGAGYVGHMVKSEATTKEVHDLIAHHFGNASEVADYYVAKLPANPTHDDLTGIMVQALGDQRFICPTTLFAEQMAKHAPASQHFYSYRLMQSVHPTNHSWQAVPHSSDHPYLFPTEHMATNSLSQNMIRSWTNFAKTGHTTKMGSVEWAPSFTDYKHPVTQYMSLHAGDYKMVAGAYAQLCDTLWKPRILG